jgi:hypothetical protein
MNGTLDGSTSATGRPKSSVPAAPASSPTGSVSLPSSATSDPCDVDCENARTCDSTIGSLSTYTTRHAGSTDCATSRLASAPGSPAPTSMNCLTPASRARNRTARR